MQERGLELEEADFCINIPGDLCGEEGMGTSSLFSRMFSSERFWCHSADLIFRLSKHPPES